MKRPFNLKEVMAHRLRVVVLEVIETAMLDYRKKQVDEMRIQLCLYEMDQHLQLTQTKQNLNTLGRSKWQD